MSSGIHRRVRYIAYIFTISGIWLLNPRLLTLVGSDGWWLACYAREFLETGQIPREVLGSYALEGYSYHHPAWLYGLWAYLWLVLGGPWLWMVMDVLIPGGFASFAVWRILKRDRLDEWTRVVLIGWVGMLFWPYQTLRGLIWAVTLYLWLLLWIREALETASPPRATLWRFPLISFLWASFHGGFFLPIGMMGIAFLIRPNRQLAWATLLAIVATFLHPYAPQNWVDHILILRHPPTFIWEWYSLPEAIKLLAMNTGESLLFVSLVTLLPYIVFLFPLLLPAPRSRWNAYLKVLGGVTGISAFLHIRHLVWMATTGVLLWGNWLGVRSFRLPLPLLYFHLLLALMGWGLRIPVILRAGYVDTEASERFLATVAQLPPARVIALHLIGNMLCWYNPELRQWVYGTNQMGVARDDEEWKRITRDVIEPAQRIPYGGRQALEFFVRHRVDYVILRKEWDKALRKTLESAGCAEIQSGEKYSLFTLRECLAEPNLHHP